MTTPTTKTKRKKLTPEERLQRRVGLYLRTRAAGKTKYARSGVLMKKLIGAGLKVGQPIIVPGHGTFELVDNFAGERTGGYATVPRFELKELSKKAANAAAAALQSEVIP
jgi:hypothetical protein